MDNAPAVEPYRQLHHQALNLATQANAAEYRGELDRCRELNAQALELECAAAEAQRSADRDSPNGALLYASAAKLAFKLGRYVQARQLLQAGLEGPTTSRTANELLALQRELLRVLPAAPIDTRLPRGRDVRQRRKPQ